MNRASHAAVSYSASEIGKASAIVVTRNFEVPHVGESARPFAADAMLALTTLGFTKREARAAVEAARDELGEAASLEDVVRAALRRTSS